MTSSEHPWAPATGSASPVGLHAIDDRMLGLVRRILQRETGILLGPNKASFVAGRLLRRIHETGHPSFHAYLDEVARFAPGSEDVQAFVNAFTINTTEFFRNPEQFRFLARLLPTLRQQGESVGRKQLRVWSAACSTGEEAYSLALILNRYFKRYPEWKVKILATDVDGPALTHASAGNYGLAAIAPVPASYRAEGFEVAGNRVQVRPEIRRMIVFRHVNLVREVFRVKPPVDVLFCRNVLIYFDAPTQVAVARKLWAATRSGGHVFVGFAESMLLSRQGFTAVDPGIHRRL